MILFLMTLPLTFKFISSWYTKVLFYGPKLDSTLWNITKKEEKDTSPYIRGNEVHIHILRMRQYDIVKKNMIFYWMQTKIGLLIRKLKEIAHEELNEPNWGEEEEIKEKDGHLMKKKNIFNNKTTEPVQCYINYINCKKGCGDLNEVNLSKRWGG